MDKSAELSRDGGGGGEIKPVLTTAKKRLPSLIFLLCGCIDGNQITEARVGNMETRKHAYGTDGR
jgi:hypothetical protein